MSGAVASTQNMTYAIRTPTIIFKKLIAQL